MRIKCSKCDTDNPSDSKYCRECATPLPSREEISVFHTETLETPPEELTRGTTFAGRYEIIEELGKGGMGKVYRAEDKKIKEEVALKLIKPEIASDKKTIERFSNELKMARKIAHRNVCKMYDLGEEKGTHYITMEYVPGEDLKRLVRKVGQFSAGKTIFIAKQVCEGLAEAHRLGVVHRDLKPQNIMVDEDGNARIMDFGIARSVKGKGITAAGVMIGTPEYMSPEQAEVKEVDQRSDVYSLGVILYEMVTGRVPFEGETPLSIAMKHKSEMPKDPREFNTQIPEDLSRVILKCLEKDKEKRCQTAEGVLSELIKIEKGIPSTEREIPKRKPITSREITVTFGLKKLFIPSLIVIVLLIAAALIWQLLPHKKAAPLPSGKPTLAILYFKNNTGDEKLDIWRSGLSDLLVSALSQSKYINVLSSDQVFSLLKRLNLLEAKSYASEDLRKVASNGSATHILQGYYTRAGDNFRINITLQKAETGEILGSENAEGPGERSFFPMVDELTREIKLSLNLTSEQMATDFDKAAGKITTDSPEALKYYLEGRKIFQTVPQRSIELIKRAIDIDPAFAMAYRALGMAYGNLGYASEAIRYQQKALELSDRVSERERYQIEGAFYWRYEKTFDKAIQAYKNLLELYSEDSTGNLNLGCIYRDLEQWDKAIEYIAIARRVSPDSVYAFGNLARLFNVKGMHDKANAVLDEYSKNNPDNEIIRAYRARNDLIQRRFQSALAEAEKGYFLNPTARGVISIRGDIYHCMDDFTNSEIEYARLLDLGGHINQISAHDKLAALYISAGKYQKSIDQLVKEIELTQTSGEKTYEPFIHLDFAYRNMRTGNYTSALKDIDDAWKSADDSNIESSQIMALHLRGVVQARMKSFSEAKQTAVQLEERIGKWFNRKLMRYYDHLLGTIELESGNFHKAIAYFDKALSLLPYESVIGRTDQDQHAFFVDSLARACFQKKDFVRAKKEYEKIIQLTTGRLYFGDIYAQSYYMLGNIDERLGDKTKAIENYQKFLDLWKDADPGLPELEDVRKRLAGLNGN